MARASANVLPSIIEHTTLAHAVMARQPRVLKPARTNVSVSGSMTANRRSATSPRLDFPTMHWALNPSGAPLFLKLATTDSNVSEYPAVPASTSVWYTSAVRMTARSSGST